MYNFCFFFQLAFRASRTTFVRGDIALDDIQLINCNFPGKYLLKNCIFPGKY